MKNYWNRVRITAGAFLLALCCLSCTKEMTQQKASVFITVSLDNAPLSKAAITEAQESKVSSLDLLVFRANDGILDSYARAEAEGDESLSSLSATVTSGISMHWYIVSNVEAGTLNVFDTEERFLNALTHLSDMSAGSMVMHASGVHTFSLNQDRLENVLLIRYACKVTMKNIRVSWLGTFDTAPSCTLDRIVLVNVRGDERFSSMLTASADDLWYNRSCVESHDLFIDSCIAWNGSLEVAGPDSREVNVSLYAMPNPSEGDGIGPVSVDNPWSPRRTRIAIRLTIDGVPQWYPVDLPSMEGKTHYVAEDVVIMGPGTPGPDEGIDRTSIDFTVNVYGWGEENRGTFVFPSVDDETP